MESIIDGFFPNNYKITNSVESEEGYIFEIMSISESATCPKCAIKSTHYHSHQEKKARDLSILGKSVLLRILQKKYYCDNKNRGTKLFIERTDFINPYSQFTARCRNYMLKIAVHVSSEAAVKILAYQGIRVSADTLLNMLKVAGGIQK